ncbi:GDP-mannose-dependent alpha-(1-6)-phosphatidylinositol monomannoside mannosyltransferase [bacterium HR40]|nr:GDP-mannose-dependent alpha-(1-6)-phosphatidylinositol monomannoside mannosyltransferase [bacterium HR40]
MASRCRRPAVIVKGWPRLSETFIAQEIRALERLGLEILIVSLRRPQDPAVHDVHRETRAEVLYLPEYLREEPLRVLRALVRCLRLSGFRQALGLWLRDVLRDPTASRGRRFGQALVLAAELPADRDWLHVHYLHTPASVGRYAAVLRGLPFSLSAHAKDIWTTPEWEKREKLRACAFAVTCTAAGLAHLAALAPRGRVFLAYHGIDLERFPRPERIHRRDGSDPEAPVVVACVARAVPKKGLDVLLDALASLPADLHWRFVHIGGGSELPLLQARARRLGIANRIEWRGPQNSRSVLRLLRMADLFCLPARVAADGDRDGLPNVLLEALSQELAVVTTPVGAIPELVEDGLTGRLVPAEDPERLARALDALARAPAERQRLAEAGRLRVAHDFRCETGIARLAHAFGLVAETGEPVA